jgi:hypothetical protein
MISILSISSRDPAIASFDNTIVRCKSDCVRASKDIGSLACQAKLARNVGLTMRCSLVVRREHNWSLRHRRLKGRATAGDQG